MRKKILVTGASGFIGGYIVAELLEHGWEVVGLDNYSKYGRVAKEHDSHPRYNLHHGDAKDVNLLEELLADCTQMLAAASMVGGIGYFHELAYDLLAENERICAASFDAAIRAFRRGTLEKITVLSSSMVFESATVFPTPEGAELTSPPPLSTYGLQKLVCEYYARGAHQQYGLPYTIVRPFNCVGIGELKTRYDSETREGNIRLGMSHVVPDLIRKVLAGQDPLRILGDGRQVRHYTYGGDLARGIRLAIEHPDATNEDFNLATEASTTVLELAELVWSKINPERPLRIVCEEPFQYDVQNRVPDCSKARRVLGFEAQTSLSTMLDELIPWVHAQLQQGTI